MQCILIIFLLSQLLPDPFHLLTQPTLSLSVSLRIIKQTRKQKPTKQAKDKKMPKLNNIYKRNKQKTRHSYMLAPGHRACPGEWLIHPVTMECRKPMFPLQEVSTAESVLVMGGILCPLPCSGTVL